MAKFLKSATATLIRSHSELSVSLWPPPQQQQVNELQEGFHFIIIKSPIGVAWRGSFSWSRTATTTRRDVQLNILLYFLFLTILSRCSFFFVFYAFPFSDMLWQLWYFLLLRSAIQLGKVIASYNSLLGRGKVFSAENVKRNEKSTPSSSVAFVSFTHSTGMKYREYTQSFGVSGQSTYFHFTCSVHVDSAAASTPVVVVLVCISVCLSC